MTDPTRDSIMADWNIQYLEDERVLVVIFPNGKSYTYRDVPPEVARGFGEADSKGEWFNREVRGKY